jgi:hypothetical protein
MTILAKRHSERSEKLSGCDFRQIIASTHEKSHCQILSIWTFLLAHAI